MREQRPRASGKAFAGAVALAAGLALAVALGTGLFSPAAAQEPDVRISQLDCEGDPEQVAIRNFGADEQDLSGWRLESDPPSVEYLDLSIVGKLLPGASVFIESGPSAGGAFKWSSSFLFRDGDASDYARLVDDTGTVVHQVNCPGSLPTPTPEPTPAPAASPTPTAEATPSPTPEVTPPAGVPNGGGPPLPASGGGVGATGVAAVAGGSLLAAAGAALGLPWRRSTPRGEGPRARPTGEGSSTAAWGVLLILMVLVLALATGRRGGAR